MAFPIKKSLFKSDFVYQDGWAAQHDVVPFPSDAEIFALVNQPNGEAVGVVVNRRYNSYTQAIPSSTCATGITAADLGGAQYQIIEDIEN
jgi:hypothetical protein